MSESNDFGMGYAMGQDSNRNSGGMFGGGDGWWGIILLALLFGWGNGGFGGGYGGGSFQGTETRAAISEGFQINGIDNGIRAVQNGLCDGFYAVNTSLLQGFNGVQAQMATLAAQQAQCCCETQRLVERGFCDTNYNLATQMCDVKNTIQHTTRDIIDNQNANTKSVLDFLVQDKITTLQAENQALKFQASQTAQNSYIAATQEAQTAELIRRLGRDVPVPAYVVPNPNCCYPQQSYGFGGCGCGCAA